METIVAEEKFDSKAYADELTTKTEEELLAMAADLQKHGKEIMTRLEEIQAKVAANPKKADKTIRPLVPEIKALVSKNEDYLHRLSMIRIELGMRSRSKSLFLEGLKAATTREGQS